MPEIQYDFLRNRGTTDMSFALPQLQEKCQYMRTHLYTTFMGPMKASGTVNLNGLWKVIQKFGCPLLFTHMAGPFSSQLPSITTEAAIDGQDPGQGSPGENGNLQLKWSGQFLRMDEERLPKRLFYGHVAVGSCSQGVQRSCYKYTLVSFLKSLPINTTTREEFASDRSTWRRKLQTGAAFYEASRMTAAKAKRTARNSQTQRTDAANAEVLPTCPRCQRYFIARIGLIRHLRA
ncbi:unnamed protein product [Dibothriocephalus latus]|uniref:Uncharacterized protein n=1 Tax=Dibothriocephalus latus TaxID=60516 RepID=A0A3P6PIG9_DIBLA|nr:unnamed protein product [Dibothriocephalus latus]